MPVYVSLSLQVVHTLHMFPGEFLYEIEKKDAGEMSLLLEQILKNILVWTHFGNKYTEFLPIDKYFS